MSAALPQVFPHAGLPARVTVYEVGARDGLQNEKATVPTAVKAQFIDRLAEAGATVVEATSFVHPKWVPQLADAEDLFTGLRRRDGVRYPVLVPNPRGYERALACGAREIAVFASATETFARRNLNTSVEGALAEIEAVVARARAAGLWVRGYVSMCFGDPWQGPVDPAAVAAVVERLLSAGCQEISLGDTIGTATPGHVRALIDTLGSRGVDPARLAVHFHDTYGQALANTLAALLAGITTVDASAGGLGGCPFAKSATGNLATEDLVWMLDGLGVYTGIDLPALVETSRWMAGHLGRPAPSRAVQALTKD
ncbi:hydroxymethylglutaryl-CoA lyase [Actinocrinis puniceicyclus]|uniref:Hydroxymethylglutaryl-CoA lyase n=1 Tax=Actinocrinis puniceicyclus TaxID=977794 RepID=A0A8J7WQI6_9ACTN|nr:hydroxymethylglutaryl-CoA lyase [Actinocrinis puniceicyclus]MBS2963619.1 hydroxymethylglutaryl-CoA lyase [Actinocrinis puniceicyclus]